jgi:hypothetical protein
MPPQQRQRLLDLFVQSVGFGGHEKLSPYKSKEKRSSFLKKRSKNFYVLS